MKDNIDSQAQSYVNQHIEPEGGLVISTPDILLNKSSEYLETFRQDGYVKTSFFELSANLTSVDGNEVISNTTDSMRADLRKKTDAMTPKEYMDQLSGLWGLDLRLSTRLVPTDGSPIYKIDDLSFTGSRGTLELNAILPEDVPIYWNPQLDLLHSGYDPDIKSILLGGDITSPLGISIALHESRHAIDGQNIPERLDNNKQMMRKIFDGKDLSPQDMETFLRFERDAHAYALQKMKGLTNDQALLHALQTEIHSHVMQQNSNMLREHSKRDS